MASAEEVLATTVCIFFKCHTCKWVDSAVLVMTGHWQDSLWRESKTAADAKKYSSESYKSKVFDRDPPDLDCSICKRLSIMQDGVPSISVATLSFLIRNCNQPRREHRSDLVFTAASCKDPIKARKASRENASLVSTLCISHPMLAAILRIRTLDDYGILWLSGYPWGVQPITSRFSKPKTTRSTFGFRLAG